MSGGGVSKLRSKKVLAVLAVLVVLVAGSGGYLALLRKPTKAVAVPGAVLPLPQTTVNLANGHLLQVGLAVQLEKGVSAKSLPAEVVPRMENAEIVTLSSFDYSQLVTAAGKASARAELTKKLEAVGGPGPVGPAVMGVYFTDFVMQ